MTFFECLIVLAILGILTAINIWVLASRPRRPIVYVDPWADQVITEHPDARLIKENADLKSEWLAIATENESLRRNETELLLEILDRDMTIYMLDKALTYKEKMRKRWRRLWWETRQQKLALVGVAVPA